MTQLQSNPTARAEPVGVEPLVPEWTEDDFYGDGLYSYLWQYHDNKPLLFRMVGKTLSIAKKLGVEKTFNQVWKAHQEVNAEQRTQIIGCNVTDFPGQPIALDCGAYVCTEHGITTTDSMGRTVTVLSHPLMPVQIVKNMDGGEERMQIAFALGGRWTTIVVSSELLSSAQKIVGLSRYGIAVTSENAKEVVKYIASIKAQNYTALPCQKATSHLGWLSDGNFSPYCKDVVYDGGSEEFAAMFDNFHPHGDESTWMELARAVRAGKSVPARIALAASFAAPLVSKLHGLPFFVHLWGTQGCGKSVGLMLAASVWGDPVIGHYAKTFNATKVMQETYAAFCGSVPVILDELQIAADRRLFDDIIYTLCEGTSKGRGSKDGGIQQQKNWSTCMITSGEMPIVQANSGGGAAVRTIEVNYGGTPLFENARNVAATLMQTYGHAGPQFVAALQSENAMEEVRATQEQFYDELAGAIQDKQVLSASIILAADRLADVAIFHDGHSLTARDIRPYLITNEEADKNRRCYDWLMGFVAANDARFHTEENNGECWGVIEDGKVYFIKSIFERCLQNAGYSSGAFLTWAKRFDKIVCEDHGEGSSNRRLTVRKQFNGLRVPCVAIRTAEDETDEYIDVSGEPMPF